MDIDQARIFCIMIMVMLAGGCSLNGTFILHNDSSHAVVLRLLSSVYEDREYELLPGQTTEIHFNFNIHNAIAVKNANKRECYVIRSIPPEWVKTTFSGPKVFAKLAASGEVFVYRPGSDEASYFSSAPPTQPDGYPLTPHSCDAFD